MFVFATTYPNSPKALFIKYDLNFFDGSSTTTSFLSFDKALPFILNIP